MLFLQYCIYAISFCTLIANENHLFSNPVPGTQNSLKLYGKSNNILSLPTTKDIEISSEDNLFDQLPKHPTLSPILSKPNTPWSTIIHEKFNAMKTDTINHPDVAAIGALAGGTVGFANGKFWTHAYKQGVNFMDQQPSIGGRWPKFTSWIKRFAHNENLLKAITIKSTGKFCIVGVGLALSHNKEVRDQVDTFRTRFLNFFK
jgi:hypothetical protein